MKIKIHFLSYLIHFFLEREIFQTNVAEKIKTHFFSSFFRKRRVYKIMWKNIVERRTQMTVWRMRIACWITKAINAHTGCEIRTAFPLQQWLHARASMLCYTYIACLVLS